MNEDDKIRAMEMFGGITVKQLVDAGDLMKVMAGEAAKAKAAELAGAEEITMEMISQAAQVQVNMAGEINYLNGAQYQLLQFIQKAVESGALKLG